MKIAISVKWVGGAGGIERSLWSMATALKEHELTVFTQNDLGGELRPTEDVCRIVLFDRKPPYPWTVWRRVVPVWRKIKAAPLGNYDLYIHVMYGMLLHHVISAKTKVVIPAGAHIGGMERYFDYVLSEASDGGRFHSNAIPSVVIPPPYRELTDSASPVDGLPRDFILTVFNPYSSIKGADTMYRLADKMTVPLVWCYSERTLKAAHSKMNHPNIIEVHDPSHAQLRWLYANCRSYVSYSRSESYGWAIAEAFANNKPVISRRVGVVTFFEGSRGLSVYTSEEELAQLLENPPRVIDGIDYDLSILSPDRFARDIQRLVEEGPFR